MKRKLNVAERYAQQRDALIERVVLYLEDCYAANPENASIPLSDVRAFLHMSAASAFVMPIVGHLQKKNLISLETSINGHRTIYLSEKFKQLAKGGN